MTTDDHAEVQLAKPMAGLRVLDFTIMMAGPYCTRMMADLGAEVIKVESIDGDPMRTSIPMRDGCSAYFGHLNAGKRSIVLDLKRPAHLKAALDLAGKVDVVVENFRPGVLDRLGLGYEAVKAANPAVIFTSISGYGQEGPYVGRPAFAPIVHASSGMDLAIMGHQESTVPPTTGIFSADVLSAMFALIATQGALAVRQATGAGQHVDVTLFESMLNLMPYEIQEAQFPQPPRPSYKPLRASDGYIMLMVITTANFENLCAAIDRQDLKVDERFVGSRLRAANRVALMHEVEAWTSLRTAQECEDHFSERGVPCARYRSVRENLDDKQVLARRSLATVRDSAGPFKVPNLPFLMGQMRPQVGASVPGLGEHTNEVLSAVAGYSTEQLRTLQVVA